ncbi:MAG: helix-turn-helix domain-containing protein [Opitutaceae bacterium]
MWREFVEMAEKRDEPFVALCARFGVSRKTGYKWLKRFRLAGEAGLQQLSRRPKSSPRRTPDAVVDAVLSLRREHPDWSGQRLRTELASRGVTPLPAPSTIDLILRRQRDDATARLQALGPDAQRFEPNYRWTVQFGVEVRLSDGTLTTPVMVRDTTTGFLVGATLLAHRRDEALDSFVSELFHRNGLPWRIQVPGGPSLVGAAPCRLHTPLTVWLMRLGVVVEFGLDEPASPGGEEQRRLAASLAALPAYQRGALADRTTGLDPFAAFTQAAARLNAAEARVLLHRIREQHNFGGKQEALQRRSPISLYRPSLRVFPGQVLPPAYLPGSDVRLVSEKGIFTFHRRLIHVGRAFAGLCVELKLTPYPERFMVLFAGQLLGVVNLTEAAENHTASLQLKAL